MFINYASAVNKVHIQVPLTGYEGCVFDGFGPIYSSLFYLYAEQIPIRFAKSFWNF